MSVPVVMLFDAENLGLTADPNLLVDNVNGSLKMFNPEFFLHQIVICGNAKVLKDLGSAIGVLKTKCDVKTMLAPQKFLKCDHDHCKKEFGELKSLPPDQDEYSRVKEVADRILVEKMLSNAHELLVEKNPNPAFLLVSSDKDFRYSAGDLIRDGCTVLAAVGPGNGGQELAETASGFWVWKDMENGVCPPRDLPYLRRHQIQPRHARPYPQR